jgi:hypothetical protein
MAKIGLLSLKQNDRKSKNPKKEDYLSWLNKTGLK